MKIDGNKTLNECLKDMNEEFNQLGQEERACGESLEKAKAEVIEEIIRRLKPNMFDHLHEYNGAAAFELKLPKRHDYYYMLIDDLVLSSYMEALNAYSEILSRRQHLEYRIEAWEKMLKGEE